MYTIYHVHHVWVILVNRKLSWITGDSSLPLINLGAIFTNKCLFCPKTFNKFECRLFNILDTYNNDMLWIIVGLWIVYRISILDSFLSGGSVGSSFLSSVKARLKASTRTRSLVACAERYLGVARLFLLFSSRLRCIPESPAAGSGGLWGLGMVFLVRIQHHPAARECAAPKGKRRGSKFSFTFELWP